MLVTIVKKEILENLISLRFVLLLLLSLTLIPLSFYVNFREYEKSSSDYRQSVQLHHDEWIKRDLMELFHQRFAVKSFRAPKPLSVFVTGLSNSMPSGFEAEAGGVTFEKTGLPDQSIFTLTGKLDFMFIIQIVFSLLAVLFTFDSICGEKENGTLKLSLSNIIPRYRFVLGKFIGTLSMLILPLIISFLSGLIILISLGFPLYEKDVMSRLILMVATAIIYIMVCVSIGIAVSSWTKSSKTSIIVLLSIWAVLTVIIPNSSEIIANVFMPTRSREVVQLEKTLLIRSMEVEKGQALYDMQEKHKKERETTIRDSEEDKRLHEQHIKSLNRMRSDYDGKMYAAINALEQEYRNSKNHQYAFTYILACLSPITPFINMMCNLAVTGKEAGDTFERSAQTYWDVLNQEMFSKIHRDIVPGGIVRFAISGKVDHRSIPQYQDTNPSLAQTIHSISVDGFLLILFMIFTFSLAYVSFLRYDVR